MEGLEMWPETTDLVTTLERGWDMVCRRMWNGAEELPFRWLQERLRESGGMAKAPLAVMLFMLRKEEELERGGVGGAVCEGIFAPDDGGGGVVGFARSAGGVVEMGAGLASSSVAMMGRWSGCSCSDGGWEGCGEWCWGAGSAALLLRKHRGSRT